MKVLVVDSRDKGLELPQRRAEHPVKIPMSDQRQHSRHCIQLPVRFSGDEFSAEGVVLDLSMGGCMVRSDVIVVAGYFLGMLIGLPGRDVPLAIGLATVRWSATDGFGVEFIRMEPEHQALLRKLIQKIEQTVRLPLVLESDR